MSMCYELCLPSPIGLHDHDPDTDPSLGVDLDVG